MIFFVKQIFCDFLRIQIFEISGKIGKAVALLKVRNDTFTNESLGRFIFRN